MKILHLYRDGTSPGGVPHQTRSLLTAQASLGHDVLMISQRPRSHSIMPANVEVLEMDSSATNVFRLAAYARAFQPDVLHVSALGIPAHPYWLGALRRIDAPLFISPHGLLAPLGMNARFGGKRRNPMAVAAKRAFRVTFDVRLLRSATAVFAQSDFEAALVRAVTDVPIAVIPAGIDTEWHRPAVARRRTKGTSTSFLFLGRIDIRHKGLDIVIAGAQALADQDVSFVIAGSPIDRRARELVRRHPRNVTFVVPAWDDVDRLIAESEFCLTMFRYAGMARMPGQAVAAGLPLIASRESNWGDWVAGRAFGESIDINVDAFVECVLRCTRIPSATYIRLVANAFHFALEFSWHNVAMLTCASYTASISGRVPNMPALFFVPGASRT